MCVRVHVYSGRAAGLQGGSGYIVILNRVFSATHSAQQSVSSLHTLFFPPGTKL